MNGWIGINNNKRNKALMKIIQVIRNVLLQKIITNITFLYINRRLAII
jgi:hypothetical protein